MSILPPKGPRDLSHFEEIGGRWVEMGAEPAAIYRAPQPKRKTSDDVTVTLADDATYDHFRTQHPDPGAIENG